MAVHTVLIRRENRWIQAKPQSTVRLADLAVVSRVGAVVPVEAVAGVVAGVQGLVWRAIGGGDARRPRD
jgi:hypothetical protein